MNDRNTNRLIACAAAALVAGCGGGGGSGGSTTPAPSPGATTSGIQGTGFAMGAITGFGSIFVNGVEFRTSSSTITVNGRSGTEAELKVGQVVSVRGRIDASGSTGTADSVAYDDEVKGPVTAVDATAGTLTVLGQTVVVTGNTAYANVAGLASIVPNTDFVEVSGFRDATGRVQATRVEKIAAPSELEVSGAIATLDTAARTFRVGAITVDYSAATTLQNFAAPAVGQRVEARGTLAAGVLRATRVEGKGATTLANGERAEVEGLITRFASASDFDVNGIRVTTNASTQVTAGLTLALGVKVEVEGTADANGTIVAAKVEPRGSGDARATGTVAAIDAAQNRITVFAVTGTVGVRTTWDDSSQARARPFNLGLLRTGDYVEIRGSEQASGAVAVDSLERRDPNSRIELRGLAKNVDVAQQRLTLLGVPVRLAAGAQCRDRADQAIACGALFTQLTATSVVSARDGNGTASTPAGGLIADRVELEN